LKETENAQKSERPGGGARRPYVPPSVTWEEDFQPYVFSTCGKMAGQSVICGVRKSS
jgi:hypothetical protein